MSKPVLRDYATLEQVAREFDRHPRTIQRWADAGLLAAARLGNLMVIDVPASRRALQERCGQNLKKRAPVK